MLKYWILGAAYAFAAVAQPGPFQAYLLSRAASHGWRRTLPAAWSPLLSDGPIIVAALFVLTRVPAWLTQGLRIAGGAFVLYLAWSAFKTWRNGTTAQPIPPATAQGSLFQAALVNFLNPNPWLSWSLVLGPLLVKSWRETPSHGVALLAGFYGVMIAGQAALIVLFGMARKLGARATCGAVAASAAALAGFGAYLVWTAI